MVLTMGGDSSSSSSRRDGICIGSTAASSRASRAESRHTASAKQQQVQISKSCPYNWVSTYLECLLLKKIVLY